MNKNIFDEALESFTDIETDVVDVLEMQNYDWWVIKRSLELGKLYKTLCEHWQSILREFQGDIFISNELSDELTKLALEIKELENE